MGKLLLTVLLLVAACATTGTVAQAPRPGAAVDGRAIYEQSCQRCHALYMPRSYSAGEWRFFVRKYGRKARLSPDQKQAVLEYLAAEART